MHSPRRILLAALAVLGAAAAGYRFSEGLGASTHLSDSFPWGIWIGFDLFAIAAAAGGFTTAFVAYVLDAKRFRLVARMGVLSALLGYPLVLSVLFMDLGRPLQFWRPFVAGNVHSAMTEVSWCILLYTSVLFVEFAPEILGRFGYGRWGDRVHRAMPVVAGIGVVLSTLHQSSLGTLYVVVPSQLHPYWYSPYLPWLFLASAIPCGLAATLVTASFVHRGLDSFYPGPELKRVGGWLAGTLLFYSTLRFLDLSVRDVPWSVPSFERGVLAVETLFGFVLPFGMLTLLRRSPARLFASGVLVLLGVLLHRMNVALTGLEPYHRTAYLPSGAEIATTAGLAAAGILAYGFLARHLARLPERRGLPQRLLDPIGASALVAATLALAVLVPSGWSARADVVPREEAAAPALALRPDPGAVVVWSGRFAAVFDHGPHPQTCETCHADRWSILGSGDRPPAHGTRGCAGCHDGVKSFAMDRDCVRCHRAESGIDD